MQVRNKIREAMTSDLSRLTEIYNQAIAAKHCTCDTKVFTVQERAQWFDEHKMSDFPVFVCESEDKVVGYSCLSPYRSGRNALRSVCEISYYIDFDYQKKGFGSSLMKHTIRVAKDKGFTNVIAILLSCNTGSINLLKRFGFSEWGEMPQIARFGDESYSHLYYGKKLKNSGHVSGLDSLTEDIIQAKEER